MTNFIAHAFSQLNNSAFVHIGARYVFYSTLLLNLLAFGERILFVFETKIGTWFPASTIPARLNKCEYIIEFATDLIEALGQLNFKDGIRPRRFNKRKNDNGNGSTDAQQNGSVESNQNSSAATAGK